MFNIELGLWCVLLLAVDTVFLDKNALGVLIQLKLSQIALLLAARGKRAQ